MATNTGKKSRKKEPQNEVMSLEGFKSVKPLNYIQETYLESIQSNDIIFGIGSAGTGKTYVAASYAAEQLYYRKINKIVLTRPNIETGRSLGFLPGSLEEKYLPYLEPFDGVFHHTLGKGFYDYCLKSKAIEPKPLGFMRGMTFDNCIVLLDEAQNCTKTELKMILSRIGRNCKIIVSGDIDQTDIKDSGLLDAVNRLEHIDNIDVVRFIDSDIVRSKMCKQIILAYKN